MPKPKDSDKKKRKQESSDSDSGPDDTWRLSPTKLCIASNLRSFFKEDGTGKRSRLFEQFVSAIETLTESLYDLTAQKTVLKAIVDRDGPESKKLKLDKDDIDSFHIEGMKYLKVRTFRGKVLIDIREYYDAGGEVRPGKKGISLSAAQWKKVVSLSDQVEGALKKV